MANPQNNIVAVTSVDTQRSVSKKYNNYTSNDFKRVFDEMIAANNNAYNFSPASGDPVYSDYTIDRIREIIGAGDVQSLHELSNYFNRYSGIYKGIINHYANLLTYDSVVVPNFKGTLQKTKIINRMNQVLGFIKDFNTKTSCKHMMRKILYDGAYYGLLKVSPDSVTIQDLPFEYCRTRFKNKYGMNLIEFDLRFFDKIYHRQSSEEFLALLEGYPIEIIQALQDYKTGRVDSSWFIIPSDISICFYYEDLVPYFTPALPSLYHYDETQDREVERDKEELQKILINKMPLSKATDEPIFDLDEMKEMHSGLVSMLKNNRYVDVITSFGDINLEQAQDVSGQAQRDSLLKFKRTAYDEAGISSELFNSSGNLAVAQSLNKDLSLAMGIADYFADWLSFQLNLRFSDSKMSFSLSFLPITNYNRKEMAALYVNGANYGYSKIYAGVAYGIEQHDIINMMMYENDILGLTDKMVPLQSSFTTSGNNEKNSEKTSQKSVSETLPDDTSGEGGRPTIDAETKADKTLANQN